MTYTTKPYTTKPFFNDCGEYITKQCGYSIEIAPEGYSQLTVYPHTQGKQAIIEIRQQQTYPDNLIPCNSETELVEAVAHIRTVFEGVINGKQDKAHKPITPAETENATAPAPPKPQKAICKNSDDCSKTQSQTAFTADEVVTERLKIQAERKRQKKAAKEPPNIQHIKDKYYVNGNEAVVDMDKGIATIIETGEIFTFRGRRALRRGYRGYQKDFSTFVVEGKSLFCSITSDFGLNVNAVQKVGQALQKWIRRHYDTLYALISYEPSKDGSWHIHLVICFADEIPNDFEAKLKKWACSYNSKPCDRQVDIKVLRTKEDVLKIYAYLNPTYGKKRDRAIYYPVGFHNFCVFGKAQNAPQSLLVPNTLLKDVLKKIEAEELPCFNTSYVFTDTDGCHIRTINNIYYSINIEKLQAICPKNAEEKYEQQSLFLSFVHLSSDEIFCTV